MDDSKYAYPGDGPTLEAAMAEFGVEPSSANKIRALYPYRVLTSLLSQACYGPIENAAGIVEAAAVHLVVLRAAVAAAEATLAEVRRGLGLDTPEAPASPEATETDRQDPPPPAPDRQSPPPAAPSPPIPLHRNSSPGRPPRR